MKTAAPLLTALPLACLLVAGCTGPSSNSPQDTAARQQATAERLADNFLDCIADIDQKTAPESFTDPATRRAVVLESCREIALRHTMVQEQAYHNACLAAGRDDDSCDREAVSKTRRDSDQLQQRASQHIDHTSASARRRSH